MKVILIDQNDTHFASLDMPALPRKDDSIEIGFPTEQKVKSFTVWRVVHKMVQLPSVETRYVEGVPVQCRVDPPWRWDIVLYGHLYDPATEVPEKCICAQGVTKCPKHGEQPAKREICPKCKTNVLGYCAQGEYCTSETCRYVC